MINLSRMEVSNVKLEISKLVWHLVFCCKSFSKEPSKYTEKLNSIKVKTLTPKYWHLKGFLDPLKCPRGRP